VWTNAARSLEPDGDFYLTPIFIQNFNQLTYLQKQLTWLLNAGYKNICVIDNHSTYRPLLQFYAEIEAAAGVHVVRRPRNGTRTTIWDEGLLERFAVTGPFVYTDSDIVPDEFCPSDVVHKLAAELRRHPHIFKAGLGLRIDNLPACYAFREEVLAWEKQFWMAPVCRGAFLAPIDTTFALYRPGSNFAMMPALRTGWPYLARHETWYQDSNNLTDEERYYVTEVEKGRRSNWARRRLPSALRTAIDQHIIHSNSKLLHLACGQETIPGWINVDRDSQSGADIVFDLDRCAERRLPIDDDSIDGFFMSRAFQDIGAKLPMMQELYRVAKPGARFIIRLHYGVRAPATQRSWRRRPCAPNSFLQYAQPARAYMTSDYAGDWSVKRVHLVTGEHAPVPSGAAILDAMDEQPDIVFETIVELRAVKPARPREHEAIVLPIPTISTTGFDPESDFRI